MSESPYIFNATQDDFQMVVVENSRRVPVLVDFWAAWCGPCQMVMPLLTKLANEYQGKFLLAKVNTEEQQGLAAQFGIRSIPTMMVFKDGQPVEEILGAQPESAIRAVLDRYIERESDQLREAAAAARRQGDTAKAVDILRAAAESDPSNPRVGIDLVYALVAQNEVDEAARRLDELRREFRDEPELDKLKARVELAEAVKDAPDIPALEKALEADPSDSEARYQLGARKVLEGDYEGALEQFLALLRRDRHYGDDAGRKGMLAVFELLGDSGDLVTKYRRLMAGALL
jgi:putative thioredoxin